MKTALLLIALIATSALAGNEAYLLIDRPDFVPALREAFYCQAPGGLGANASSGAGSELADDFPPHLIGQSFDTMILYVAEWLAPWIDPLGLVVRIYDGQCPPVLEPDREFYFPWSEVFSEFFHEIPGTMIIYQVTIPLPETITIGPQMSFGAFVDNDWGENPPFCGFFSTVLDDIYGCGEAYWEYPPDNVLRWTPISVVGGYHVDLGFCLELGASPVYDSLAGAELPTRMANFPNPFNPATTITFDLARPGPVSLAVHDAAGRRVTVLMKQILPAGIHQTIWHGQDSRGLDVPSGVYYSVLEGEGIAETRKMVLLK